MDIVNRCTDVQHIYANRGCGINVFSGRHPQYGDIAIKIINCSSENSLRFYEREGRIAVSVTHPSICKVFEQGNVTVSEKEFEHYIVMEKAHSDLNKEVRKRTSGNREWREQSLLNMLEQAVSALVHAQRNQVCHRDIKPQNILMARNGRLKLADFGSANEGIASSRVQTLTLQGTPMYLSPELRDYFARPDLQKRGKPRYNPYKSDVYSLGLTFLHLISLRAPAELSRLEGLAAVTRQKIQNLGVSSNFKEILTSMLAIQEEYRPDFIQLEEVLSSLLYGSIRRRPKLRPLLENYMVDPSDPHSPIPEEEDDWSESSQVISPPDSAEPSVSSSYDELVEGFEREEKQIFRVSLIAVQGGADGQGMPPRVFQVEPTGMQGGPGGQGMPPKLLQVEPTGMQGGPGGQGMPYKTGFVEIPVEMPVFSPKGNGVGIGRMSDSFLLKRTVEIEEPLIPPRVLEQGELPDQSLPRQSRDSYRPLPRNSEEVLPYSRPKPSSSQPASDPPRSSLASSPLQPASNPPRPSLASSPLQPASDPPRSSLASSPLQPASNPPRPQEQLMSVKTAGEDFDRDPEPGQCVNCFVQLDSTAVNLSCSHQMCSPECMKIFLEQKTQFFKEGLAALSELRCPVRSCQQLINEAVIRSLQYDNSTIRSFSKRKQTTCLECRKPTSLPPLSCSHLFCQKCLDGWCKLAAKQGLMTIVCSVCRQELTAEDLGMITNFRKQS